MINTELGELTDDVDGLGDQLGDLTGDLDMLTTEANRRLEELENPDILSCSDSEVCIPDGVAITTEGIADIIRVVCEHEIDCCDETELNLKFGPAIETVGDCEELFTDAVENGFSPDFFGNVYDMLATPDIVYQILGVAQALNDPRVRVEIDPEGVQECVAYLDVECPQIPEGGETVDPVCTANYVPEEYPCSLDNLLNGLQEEGELCGDYAFGEGDDIPECLDGFYCSFEGYSANNQGLCAKLPDEGDYCQDDYGCDPFGYNEGWSPKATNLYCNFQTAKCEPLGREGDDCAFISDDFSITDEYMYPTSRTATSQDCMPGLTCDPTSNTCVANCSEGRFCSPGSDPFLTCGPDLLCNITGVPELFDSWNLGTCAPPIDDGDTCNGGFECASGKCQASCDPETFICECSVVKEPGDDCTTPGYDESCSTNWCGTNGECAETCQCDENGAAGDCDANVGEGPAMPTACPSGFYCDFGSYVQLNDPQYYALYACEARIANGSTCDTSQNPHASCASGFCDPELNQCAAKVAMDAMCPSGADEQCRANQYCNNNLLCRTYAAAGMNCDLMDVSGIECAAGLECVDAGTDTCQALAESGEACNINSLNEPPCNTEDDPTLECVDIDGALSGVVFECYSYMRGRGDGIFCNYQDSYCASGWCRPDAAVAPMTSVCAEPLEEGDDCDTSSGHTADVCAEGLYCNYAQGETNGKCAPQQGPGGPCKPYFFGSDCVSGGSCTFTKDQYLCNEYSLGDGELFCGSN